MTARYGDNIYDIVAQTRLTLRAAGWPQEKIEELTREIMETPGTYDDAVAKCRRYITIRSADDE